MRRGAMIKIIHTSDLHLDACFSSSGISPAQGNRRRQCSRDVFESIIVRTGQWEADALLIAGDLFEGDRVTRHTLTFLAEAFESISQVPVFIAPGSHDPYTRDSAYTRQTWPSNVTIFQEPRWTEHAVGDLVVHGFGYDGSNISKNPFGALRVKKKKGNSVHVGVAYGVEQSLRPKRDSPCAPFMAKDAAAEGLAYLALGHHHTSTELKGDFKTTMRYSGTPQGLGFEETGLRKYLEVVIDKDEVKVTPVASSKLLFATHSISCEGLHTADDLIDTIRKVQKRRKLPQAVRVVLTDECSSDLRNRFSEVHEELTPDFDSFEIVDQTRSIERYEDLAREETSLGALLRGLNAQLADATSEERRAMLLRARETGLAAFRDQELDLRWFDTP